MAGGCLRREFMNNLIWRSVTCRPGKKSVLPKGKTEPCSRRRYRQTRPEGRSPPLRGCLPSGYALPSTAPQRHSHPDCRAVLTLIVAQQEMDHHGNIARILRRGTNGWVCMPGDENKIGDPPMWVDELGVQWFKNALTGQPRPTNRAPGLCYMLFGATQHSNTDPSDKTSPAIPIGPHWMILWPFDPTHCGLPTTVRDAGAWIMFAGTPYAYLHICGTPLGSQESPHFLMGLNFA